MSPRSTFTSRKRRAPCTPHFPLRPPLPQPHSSEVHSLSLWGASGWICPRTPFSGQVSPSPSHRVHRVDQCCRRHHNHLNPRRSLEWDFNFLACLSHRGRECHLNILLYSVWKRLNQPGVWRLLQDLQSGSIMFSLTGNIIIKKLTYKLNVTKEDKVTAHWRQIPHSISDRWRHLEPEDCWFGRSVNLLSLFSDHGFCLLWWCWVCAWASTVAEGLILAFQKASTQQLTEVMFHLCDLLTWLKLSRKNIT